MTLEEMHQVLELTNDVKKHKGTILGKLNGKAVCLPKDTRMNRNIAVYGASGSIFYEKCFFVTSGRIQAFSVSLYFR